jgi:hypothetical protein
VRPCLLLLAAAEDVAAHVRVLLDAGMNLKIPKGAHFCKTEAVMWALAEPELDEAEVATARSRMQKHVTSEASQDALLETMQNMQVLADRARGLGGSSKGKRPYERAASPVREQQHGGAGGKKWKQPCMACGKLGHWADDRFKDSGRPVCKKHADYRG